MKRVGRSNKPGINKAAEAVRKNSQNILDAGALVIQRSSEEVTGKVQKYARMDARQFVPYSSQEEGTLSVTDGVVTPKCLRLQEVPEFLLKMYPRFWIFFILGGLLGFVCKKFRDVGNMDNLNMVNFYYLVETLIVKHELI